MHRCEHGDTPRPNTHAHVFIDMNGFPYLLAEYMDRNRLQHVDRSAIVSGITIDTSDAMRAVIDISINDIGERSDSTPNIVGNSTKTKRLLNIISRNANRLEGNLPVLKSGIIMRVNYQLEVQRTTQVLRSMVEDLRISDRSYFLDINRLNFDDNAVVTNFSNSMVSTINEFTHGRERMVLRITNVQMFYELVSDRQPIPRIKQSLTAHPYDCPNSHILPGTNEEYYYHREMQHRHYIGDPPGYTENELISPPQWAMFNQFYHFDQDGRRIVLHRNEIYDPMIKTTLIPCGTANVNRMFVINPGHRLIFKFSVWKNDVTAIFDTLNVARALKAKFYNCCDDHHHHHECQCNHDNFDDHWDHNHGFHDHHHKDDEYRKLVSMLYEERQRNELNGKTINELLTKINVLEDKIAELGGDTPGEGPITPVEPGTPEDPSEDCECGCDHTDINEKLDYLGQKVDEEDIDPMPTEVVEQIFQEVTNNETQGGF